MTSSDSEFRSSLERKIFGSNIRKAKISEKELRPHIEDRSKVFQSTSCKNQEERLSRIELNFDSRKTDLVVLF